MDNDLLILGDVYLDRVFSIKPAIGQFILNLEYPLSSRGIPVKGKVNLRQGTSFIFETFGNFPKAVILANNHIFDYGIDAFMDTLQFLDHHNIPFFGAGARDNNFNNPFIFNTGKRKVAFLAYCSENTGITRNGNNEYGVAVAEWNRINNDIEYCREKADKVIVILHEGEEEIAFPSISEIEQAHKIIQAGADAYVAHHPHVIKPFEIYRGKSIYYSIGNFIFPDLNLRTYWNGVGFTRTLRKKQNRLNREGLVLAMDENGEISKVYKSFQNGNVISLEHFIAEDKGSFLNSNAYPGFYQKYYSSTRKKQLFRAFMSNPRIPRMKSIFEMFKI